MSEQLWNDPDKNQIVYDGKSIFFAHGDDPGSFFGLLLFLHLLAFPFLLSLFMYLFKKYQILSTEYQFIVPFIFTILLCVSSFFIINKKFSSNEVNVSLEQRKNVITIDMNSKTVTVKEKNTIIENYTLGQDDYFWFPEQSSDIKSYRNTTTYVISFVHNNQQTVVASSGNRFEITKLFERLGELGFVGKKDH